MTDRQRMVPGSSCQCCGEPIDGPPVRTVSGRVACATCDSLISAATVRMMAGGTAEQALYTGFESWRWTRRGRRRRRSTA